MNATKEFDEILKLFKDYTNVRRRTIALDKYQELQKTKIGADIRPMDLLVRESLVEHVGSLPIVATYLYPKLEHKEKIDLGKVLIMLGIHDIGETVVGDGHPHQKTQTFVDDEFAAALSLLPEMYHDYLGEYEERKTLDAKFAKSVDVFATFLTDQLLPPEFVAERHDLYGFSWKQMDEKRDKMFNWDNYLHELFKEVIVRYQAMY